MSNDSRTKYSTFEQRVEWLVNHTDLWYQWLSSIAPDDFVAFYFREPNKKRTLIEDMKKDGIFSIKSYWSDIKLNHELYAAQKIVRSQLETHSSPTNRTT